MFKPQIFKPQIFKPWKALLAAVLIGCGGAEASAAGQHGRVGVVARGGHHAHHAQQGHPLRGAGHTHGLRGGSSLGHPFAHRQHSFGGASYAQVYTALYIYALGVADAGAAAPTVPASQNCAALHERIKTAKGWQWRTHYDACGRGAPARTGHFR
jgi:hypothetical protein